MDPLVYPRERTLGSITLVLGIIFWLALIGGTFGVALLYVFFGFLGYVFAQSAWVAHIRGSAVRVSAEQFPDLHARLQHCCQTLGLKEVPETYVINGNGIFNAMAARFFGRNFVVLLSDVVDALEDDAEGINFYIGHELGHIRRGHLTGHIWRMPAAWLPLVGAAYSRAKEYSCDRHGRACCATPESAARALAVLAAGPQRWKQMDLENFSQQSLGNAGFWGSFHELIGGYPWLNKRLAVTLDPARKLPQRNGLAYVLAFFVPYGGRAGGGFAGVMVLIAMIGVLAAIALPAYQDYTNRAKLSGVIAAMQPAKAVLTQRMQRSPQAGLLSAQEQQAVLASVAPNKDIAHVEAYAAGDYADIVVSTTGGPVKGNVYLYSKDGGRNWVCGSDDIAAKQLPLSCRDSQGIERPSASLQKQGAGATLWSADFAKQAVAGCVQNRSANDPNGAQGFCECMVSNLSSAVPEQTMRLGNFSPETNATIADVSRSCAP